MSMKTKAWLALGACLGVAAAGCGGEDTGGGEATGLELPEVGETAMALVTPDEGGEIRLADFRLEVPSGAVREDITLQLEVQSADGRPERESLRGPVYELGPDGTRFERPITLELPVERLPRDDERAEVVWFDEERDRWERLEDSQVMDGRVIARTDHFTAFTVRFRVVDGEVVAEQVMCDTEFEPCGGNIEGTWQLQSACEQATTVSASGAEPAPGSSMDEEEAGSDAALVGSDRSAFFKQSDPSCDPNAVAEFRLDIEGTITFADGMTSGTQTIASSGESRVAASCFEGRTCEEAGAVTEGDQCVYAFDNPGEAFDLSGTYTTEGGTLNIAFDDDPASEEEDIFYCVQGDTITISSTSSDGYVFRFNGTRQ